MTVSLEDSSPTFPAGTAITRELTEGVKGCRSIIIDETEWFPIKYEDQIVWSPRKSEPDAHDYFVCPTGTVKTQKAW